MKVLIIAPKGSDTIFTEVVQFLEGEGCEVVMGVMSHSPERHCMVQYVSTGTSRPKSLYNGRGNIVKGCSGYDVIVLAIHCTRNRFSDWFCGNVTPRLGYVVMEHDLLSHKTEMGKIEKSLGVVTFNLIHHKWAKEAGFKCTMARWVKLDCLYPEYEMKGCDPWRDAVFIGSGDTAVSHKKLIRVDLPFKHPDLFRTLWFKSYLPTDMIKKGMKKLPEHFLYPHGSKYCADIAKFHFTVGSSSYADALLFGSLPIVYREDIATREERVDDIVSRANWQCFHLGLVVTHRNLPRKIKALRKDRGLYEQTLHRLKGELFPDDYEDCPTTGQAVWSLIEGR